jgi:hypothetical protein
MTQPIGDYMLDPPEANVCPVCGDWVDTERRYVVGLGYADCFTCRSCEWETIPDEHINIPDELNHIWPR